MRIFFKNNQKIVLTVFSGLFVALLTPHFVYAQVKKPAALEAGNVSTTPFGWVDFCRRQPKECEFRSSNERIIKLDDKSWYKIVALNDKVNREIDPVTDLEYNGQMEYWTYPINKKGDCEDYVLLKRKLLAEMGFPLEALLMTIVKDQNNEGHAILTVRTDYGDFILDNQEEKVKLWSQTPYRFLKRQSPFNPNDWLALGVGAAETLTSRK